MASGNANRLTDKRQLRAIEYLKARIREAEASGEPEEVTAEYWDEVRKRLRQKQETHK